MSPPHRSRLIYSKSFQPSCPAIKKKITRDTKRQKHNKYEETEQTSEPDTAGMLELSDQKFRTIMIATLKALMDRLDGMQEQMAMEAERWKPRERNEEMLEI